MDHHCEAITETYRQLAALHGSWVAISLGVELEGQLMKHKPLIYRQHDLTLNVNMVQPYDFNILYIFL